MLNNSYDIARFDGLTTLLKEAGLSLQGASRTVSADMAHNDFIVAPPTATWNLLLTARALGLGTVWLDGFTHVRAG